MRHPFTEQELFLAFRRFLPPTDAAAMARALVEPSMERPAPDEIREEGWAPAPSVDFTQETLALLALQSPQSRARVERYMADLTGRDMNHDESRAWEATLREMRDSFPEPAE
jgi:hypothetical protein